MWRLSDVNDRGDGLTLRAMVCKSVRRCESGIVCVELNQSAEAEHSNMLHTHRVRSLLAYNLNGARLHPTVYQSVLLGSHVCIEFTMLHWFIHGINNFVAEIEHIRIIQEAGELAKASKRKEESADTDEGSSAKKGTATR